jgi:hypothetical protein
MALMLRTTEQQVKGGLSPGSQPLPGEQSGSVTLLGGVVQAKALFLGLSGVVPALLSKHKTKEVTATIHLHGARMSQYYQLLRLALAA